MRQMAILSLCVLTHLTSFARGDEAPAVAINREPQQLTSARLDLLVEAALPERGTLRPLSDEQFLRRASLDLIGRQPTLDEMAAFLAEPAADRRSRAIERLLASPEYGRNWANYWSDTIGYRVSPPELTFLNYGPFEEWLAGRLNDNARWDEVVREILVGTGKVKDQPAATFVAYHQGEPTKLAAETARVFLGVSIQCAECHDHPFDLWKREQFHQLAAFFVRTGVKMPWNEGAETVVSDKKKGEYAMPDVADPRKKGKEMAPAYFDGTPLPPGQADLERRRQLAELIADPANGWFARAYVNRVWARLMGQGFYEPVDNIGQFQPQLLPEVHAALAESFVVSGCDVKSLFRTLMNSELYQQGLPGSGELAAKPFEAAEVVRLRGDEVFDSLEAAIALPNVTPPPPPPKPGVRFPPPPKSTRELVTETFGYDPSLPPDAVVRTMSQAMLMMNNDQLQAQVDARPESGTALSKLLARQPDDEEAVVALFQMVLARKPTLREASKSLEHITSVENRGAAFEDLLWALVNSTEFTTKR